MASWSGSPGLRRSPRSRRHRRWSRSRSPDRAATARRPPLSPGPDRDRPRGVVPVAEIHARLPAPVVEASMSSPRRRHRRPRRPSPCSRSRRSGRRHRGRPAACAVVTMTSGPLVARMSVPGVPTIVAACPWQSAPPAVAASVLPARLTPARASTSAERPRAREIDPCSNLSSQSRRDVRFAEEAGITLLSGPRATARRVPPRPAGRSRESRRAPSARRVR